MAEATESVPANDPIIERLEDQINWYDRKSRSAQRIYKRVRWWRSFSRSAVIPLLAGLSFPHDKLVIAFLGVLITVLEGILHLNQYQQLWSAYRSTCEALKHERYVYSPRPDLMPGGRPARNARRTSRGLRFAGTRAMERDPATDREITKV